MLRSSNPANAVVSVEFNTSPSFFFRSNLQTILIDKHIRGSALQFVCGDGLLDRLYGGSDDGVQTFLVHRTLNGNVRKDRRLQAWWGPGRVELGVDCQL